jgi:hypothetical protein
MIPVNYRSRLLSELTALGGTPEQIEKIGDILFRVSALDTSRDAEYLIETRNEQTDPLVKQACWLMLETLGYKYEVIETPTADVEGVWFIYGWDAAAYPIGMHTNELEARRIAGDLGYFAEVIFWPNGVLWDDLKRTV